MPPLAAHSLLRSLLPAAVACVGLSMEMPAYAETPTPPTGAQLAFTITDPRVTESSGLARDTDNDVFWTINDSGDHGIAYAIGPDGRTSGTVEFNADPVDVEAIAYVDSRLFIADIGDNVAQRETVSVFVINSPVPGRDQGDEFTTYEFRYPDGPKDAEALLVDETGRIRIVTKAAEGGIYIAPEELDPSAPNELTRVADAPAWVTDGTVLPTGEFVVRTYLSVEVLDRETYESKARARLPFQPQGESLAVSMADDALLIGSEGAQSRVLRVPIPSTIEEVPPAEAVPPPSPTPEPDPNEDGISLDPSRGNRSGTLSALALAALVSVAPQADLRPRGRGETAPPPVAARRSWDDNRTGDDDNRAGDWEGDPADADVERVSFPDETSGNASDDTEIRPAIRPDRPDEQA